MEVVESTKWGRTAHATPVDSKVGQFEAGFAKFQDARYALGVSNGTVAIEVALRASGVKPGDEVVMPAAAFVSVATAVVNCGAIPVFVDVDPRTYLIDPGAAEAAITPRTRAILAVDNGGLPCDTDALNAISARRGVAVVSDCAHSHGSQWKGVGTGALGRAGAFSFQQGKLLSCGEGGMILTNDEEVACLMDAYHHVGGVPGRPGPGTPVVSLACRMTEWQGAVGLAQLSRLKEQTETRERNLTYLNGGLREIDGVAPIHRDPRVTRWGFYLVHFRFLSEAFGGVSRDTFRRALAAEGVSAGAGHTQPLYRHPIFAGQPGLKRPCPQTERIADAESWSLGHAVFLGPVSDMDLILDAVRKLRRNVDELRKVGGG
jgi:dTDP-4-amino-4,6-dideoxygalactose transaminase